jgi:hypothetical protein
MISLVGLKVMSKKSKTGNRKGETCVRQFARQCRVVQWVKAPPRQSLSDSPLLSLVVRTALECIGTKTGKVKKLKEIGIFTGNEIDDNAHIRIICMQLSTKTIRTLCN